MLVAFEGQYGAGKTSLLEAVHRELARAGVDSLVVEEFSDSPYGRRLVEVVGRDRFLRPVPGEQATVFTRACEEVADLYYLDECVIGPGLARGQVVLKDRHYDTLLYSLVPMLVSGGAIASGERALAWVRGLLSELRHLPDLTIYVDAPTHVRLRRIADRPRDLDEDQADQVSVDDHGVFAARERILPQLMNAGSGRRVIVDNATRPLEQVAQEVARTVLERLQARSDSISTVRSVQ